MLKCAECGASVSEWAERCTYCGHSVAESLSAVRTIASDEPSVVHGLVLGDVPADPVAAIWSRDGGAGLPPVTTSPDAGPPVEQPLEEELAAGDPSPPPVTRRRRWAKVGVGVVGILVVLGLIAAVARPHGEADGAVPDLAAVRPAGALPTSRWSADVGDRYPNALVRGDGTLYVVATDSLGDSSLTAFDDETGEQRWTFEPPAGSYISASPGVAPSGVMLRLSRIQQDNGSLVGGEGASNRLVMYDRLTGDARWAVDSSVYLLERHAERSTPVFVGEDETSEHSLSTLDTETGALTRVGGLGSVAIFEDRVFIDDGPTLTSRRIDALDEVITWPVDESPPLLALLRNDLLVVISENSLTGIDPNGERWSIDNAWPVTGLARLDGDRVLVAGQSRGDPQLAVIDVGDDQPEILWTEEASFFGQLVTRSLAIVSRDGALELAEVGADGLTRLIDFGDIDDVEVLAVSSELVVVRDRESVTAYRLDGSEAWSLEVGADASVAAVDDGLLILDGSTLTFYD